MSKTVTKPTKVRTLGPISDLERHLPDDWWSTLFNSLYLKTDGDVVENFENTRSDIDLLFQTLGLMPGDALLDVCCGQGRHSLELARRGFRDVSGVDRSRYLVRLARKRNKESRLGVVFSEGDARALRVPKASKDAVFLMGNSFGYFERAEDDERVLSGVFNIRNFVPLSDDMRIYFNCPDEVMQNEEGWKYQHMNLVLSTSDWDSGKPKNEQMAGILQN